MSCFGSKGLPKTQIMKTGTEFEIAIYAFSAALDQIIEQTED
jgi:hypothetical protein